MNEPEYMIKLNKKVRNNKILKYAIKEIENRILKPDYLLCKIVGEKELNSFLDRLDKIIINIVEPNQAKYKNIKKQGYVIEVKNQKTVSITITAIDENGVIYGIRDLYHYYLKEITKSKKVEITFTSNPAIKERWLWTWDVGIYNEKKYIEMMSEWKYNGLIMWSSKVPSNAKEIIEFAHERGIKIILGFSWGYPDFIHQDFIDKFTSKLKTYCNVLTGKNELLCPTNKTNKEWIFKHITNKYKNEYSKLNIDGIYFQAFTEGNRCPCAECSEYSTGELLLNWCMPIRNKLKQINPKLFVSWGIHTWWGNIMFSNRHEFDGGIKPLEYRVFQKVPNQDQLLWEGEVYPEKDFANTNKLLNIRGKNENVGLMHRIYRAYELILKRNNDLTVHQNIIKRWNNIEKDWIPKNKDWYKVEKIKSFIEWCKFVYKSTAKEKTIVHLLEGTDWGYYNRFIPILTSEIEWNPNRTKTDFIKLFNSLKQISDWSSESPLYKRYINGLKS